MSEVAPRNTRDLEIIREKMIQVPKPDPDDLIFAVVADQPTPFRAEFATAEVAPLGHRMLRGRIERARKLVLDAKQDFRSHSDYEIWLQDQLRTKEELAQMFWLNVGSFETYADLVQPQPTHASGGEKLWFYTLDGEDEVKLEFSFDDKYRVQIGVGNPESTQLLVGTYNSSLTSIDQVLPIEYRVMTHYLNQFTAQASA